MVHLSCLSSPDKTEEERRVRHRQIALPTTSHVANCSYLCPCHRRTATPGGEACEMGSRQVRALNPWRLPACTLHMLRRRSGVQAYGKDSAETWCIHRPHRFALLGLPISSAESARTRLVVATQRMHRHKQLQQLRNSAAGMLGQIVAMPACIPYWGLLTLFRLVVVLCWAGICWTKSQQLYPGLIVTSDGMLEEIPQELLDIQTAILDESVTGSHMCDSQEFNSVRA
eukprot:scaffold7579_cov430-Prasinococcus_capsulatus_cf.AAC.2